MAIDFSFLENAAPQQPEPEPVKQESGVANVTIRVDADCFMQCDGEFVDVPLKAGMMAKTQLPVGQHLLEFFAQENPNVKVEKIVEWPESDKNYLVMVNDLQMKLAPAMPQQMQQPQMQMPPQNQYLDQLNQMQGYNPLLAAQQMNAQVAAFQQQMNQQMQQFGQQMGQQTPPPFPPSLENK